MLHHVHTLLAAEVRAKGCPLPVVYGPERGTDQKSTARSRIVLERDRQLGDKTGPGKARNVNPRMLFARALGCVCRIFAQSTSGGASVHLHERLADQTWDLVAIALDKVIRGLPTSWRIIGEKFLDADELAARGLQTWSGVVYEVRFQMDRAVNDVTWAGDAKDEFTVTADNLESTTQVTLNGSDLPPETACGEP